MKCTQKKSIRLSQVAMMLKDCKHLIELKHIHTEQMYLKDAKVR